FNSGYKIPLYSISLKQNGPSEARPTVKIVSFNKMFQNFSCSAREIADLPLPILVTDLEINSKGGQELNT
ncbi:hypothetical protein KSS87_002828, partial [Heliosperma pusillum]